MARLGQPEWAERSLVGTVGGSVPSKQSSD